MGGLLVLARRKVPFFSHVSRSLQGCPSLFDSHLEPLINLVSVTENALGQLQMFQGSPEHADQVQLN